MTVSEVNATAEQVRQGDRAACYALLQRGIDSGWLPELKVPASADPEQMAFPAAVPKRILQYWHGTTLPDDVQLSIERLKALHPDFEHELCHDAAAREFIHARFGAEAVRLFDVCFHPAIRADFWRICAFFADGGIYVDVDIRCYAPLARVTGGAEFGCFLLYAVGMPWCIENGFIAARKEDPVIGAILKGMMHNLERYARTGSFENTWVETGPGVTTTAVMRHIAGISGANDPAAKADGLLLRHHAAAGESYSHDELACKASAEGNWRYARTPVMG